MADPKIWDERTAVGGKRVGSGDARTALSKKTLPSLQRRIYTVQQEGGSGTLPECPVGDFTHSTCYRRKCTGECSISSAGRSSFTSENASEITVEVDRDNLITESDESNNTLTVIGTCVG